LTKCKNGDFGHSNVPYGNYQGKSEKSAIKIFESLFALSCMSEELENLYKCKGFFPFYFSNCLKIDRLIL